MKQSKSAKMSDQHLNGHISPFKLAKLFDSEASWDKLVVVGSSENQRRLFKIWGNALLHRGSLDQLGDVLHWIRQVVGLAFGLMCGAIPLIGGIWILVFLTLSSAIAYSYYALILKVDEEEFGGHGTLLQEGLFASFTLFLLSWIVVYSLVHF